MNKSLTVWFSDGRSARITKILERKENHHHAPGILINNRKLHFQWCSANHWHLVVYKSPWRLLLWRFPLQEEFLVSVGSWDVYDHILHRKHVSVSFILMTLQYFYISCKFDLRRCSDKQIKYRLKEKRRCLIPTAELPGGLRPHRGAQGGGVDEGDGRAPHAELWRF